MAYQNYLLLSSDTEWFDMQEQMILEGRPFISISIGSFSRNHPYFNLLTAFNTLL